MKFKDFAHLLHPSIGAGSSTHAFTRSLFEAIVTEDGLDILNGYNKESFKAYYNGNTKISGLARKISPYVEPFGFSEYIGSFQDCAIQGLCEVFQKYIPDINLHNAGGPVRFHHQRGGCCHKKIAGEIGANRQRCRIYRGGGRG